MIIHRSREDTQRIFRVLTAPIGNSALVTPPPDSGTGTAHAAALEENWHVSYWIWMACPDGLQDL
jgi:hypothetical protein